MLRRGAPGGCGVFALYASAAIFLVETVQYGAFAGRFVAAGRPAVHAGESLVWASLAATLFQVGYAASGRGPSARAAALIWVGPFLLAAAAFGAGYAAG